MTSTLPSTADGREYDPTDLAFLVAGFVTAGGTLCTEACAALEEVARILHELWLAEEAEGGVSFVWAYEVAEPLGEFLADVPRFLHDPDHEAIRARARLLIEEAA